MTFPLLALEGIQFFAKPDKSDTIIASVVTVVILLIVAWAFYVHARSSDKSGSFARHSLKKRAKKLGLSSQHIKLLNYYVKATNFLNPNRALDQPQVLDSLLRKSMAHLESQNLSPKEKELRRSLIFQIKQIVEANSQSKKIIATTLSLQINTEVTIRTRNGEEFESYITSNMQNMIGFQCPGGDREPGNYPWPKGEELGITLIRGGTEVYAFKSKVLGYKRVRGVLSVFVEHGKNLQQIQNRRAKRKEINGPALFYPVDIVGGGKGREEEKQAVVNKSKRILGTLQDISTGGCAILSNKPLPKAALIKVDFEPEKGRPVTVYGKVKGLTPKRPRGAIMHIQFTNVSRMHLNNIRDYIYEYLPEEED